MKKSLLFLIFLVGCSHTSEDKSSEKTTPSAEVYYKGVDLSYVNEMIDCGALYHNEEGVVQNPYNIFSNAGANLVRVRLWHNPTWTQYSNFEDVKKTLQRASENKMSSLLDFHYSDTWADPAHQEIPQAWKNIESLETLKDSVYNYTKKTLIKLYSFKLIPTIVQVGNEINTMVMQTQPNQAMDWSRNAQLINAGIRAVRDFSESIEQPIGVMLHIAQPENALSWFPEAIKNGLTDFDWIGLSYYPKWSKYKPHELLAPLKSLIKDFEKRLMIVETAYPFDLENGDAANNILDEGSLIEVFPATQEGQYQFLKKLDVVVKDSGGEGVVYWEPAWVSTQCNTLWGQGSHWDNATLFDHDHFPTFAFKWLED